jgi:hypothetical protein
MLLPAEHLDAHLEVNMTEFAADVLAGVMGGRVDLMWFERELIDDGLNTSDAQAQVSLNTKPTMSHNWNVHMTVCLLMMCWQVNHIIVGPAAMRCRQICGLAHHSPLAPKELHCRLEFSVSLPNTAVRLLFPCLL